MLISDWSSDVGSSDLPGREFDATENTLAAYAQAKYAVDLSSSISLDGVVGVRYILTDRTIGTFVSENKGPFERLAAKTTDNDWLPNATARLRIGDGIQIRLGYAKSLRRPNFGALNPAVTLNPSNKPHVPRGGTAGHPDPKVHKTTTNTTP